jgi:general secretion pathway protein J
MNPSRRVCGFTLIELLVALVIFGIFAVLAYAGLARLSDNRGRLTEEQRVWQELSQAFLRISDDVAHARARGVRGSDAGGVALPAFAGRPFDPRALGEPSLELTRGGELNYGGGLHSDLRRVAYRLKEGRLLRLTWPVLDRAPVSVPLEAPLLGIDYDSLDDPGHPHRAVDVETFELRFYEKSGGWVDTWPTATSGNNVPPRAMEVTLAVKGVGRFKRLFLVNR